LTALDAALHRNVGVKAIVINETPESTVPLADTAATLARFCGTIPVVTLPRLDATRFGATADASAFTGIADLL
jgi:dethiobiotin synthetase